MFIIYGYGLCAAALPLLTPWWQQGATSLDRIPKTGSERRLWNWRLT